MHYAHVTNGLQSVTLERFLRKACSVHCATADNFRYGSFAESAVGHFVLGKRAHRPLPHEKVVLHATASPALKVPDGIGPAGVGFRSSSPDHDPFYHKVMTARKRKLVDALT